MANTQRWYVEEEQTPPVASPVVAVPPVAAPASVAGSGESVSGLSGAQIAAIAAEAGVTVDFVRQSLQTAGPKTAQAEEYRVTFRVRKPRRLPRRRKIAAVAVPLTLGLLEGLGMGGAVVAQMSQNHLFTHSLLNDWMPLFNNLFLYGSPILALLMGLRLGSKRLGVLAGSVFGTALIAGLIIPLHQLSSSWQNDLSGCFVPWLVFLAVGAAAGLTGAWLRRAVPRVRRRVRERIKHLSPLAEK